MAHRRNFFSNLAIRGFWDYEATGHSYATLASAYGINVVYLERPNKTVPYTMEMIGGDWTDTNIDSPAGGVAPGGESRRPSAPAGRAGGYSSSSSPARPRICAGLLSSPAGHQVCLSSPSSRNAAIDAWVPGDSR